MDTAYGREFSHSRKIAENLVQETLRFRYLKFLMSIAENPMTQMEIPSADGSCTKAQAVKWGMEPRKVKYGRHLEDHPRTCKFLATMVGLFPLPNGGFMAYKWRLLTTY